MISLQRLQNQKFFQEEILIRSWDTTLLQIFCEFVINSKVIWKIIKGPEDNCQENSQAVWGAASMKGLTHSHYEFL